MPRLKGLEKHLRRLRNLSDRAAIIRMANAVVYEGADMIHAEAHLLISLGSVSGKGHVASRPGDPPMRDTGGLQAHIETDNPKPLLARVTSSARYAAALEFGTSKMTSRPYMRPARDKMTPLIRRQLVRRFDQLVKRSG